MTRAFWSTLALLMVVGPAFASGYDDFARGITASVKGDNQTAITALSAALKAGDLTPGYVPSAYRARAIAYLAIDKCQEALADINASAALRPLDATGYSLRSSIKFCLKDVPGAQQDFDTYEGVDPDPFDYWTFGERLWEAGQFDAAYANLLRAVDLLDKQNETSHAPYILLWYAVTADRVGKLDAAKLSGKIDLFHSFESRWPLPLLDLYIGKLEPAAAWGEIMSHPGLSDYTEQKCETDFFVGEWYLNHNKPDDGKKAIASTLAGCPKSYTTYSAAEAEAKRLGLPVQQKAAP